MSRTKLRIHIWPEKILRKKCRKVKVIDEKIGQQFSEMLSIMRLNSGVGLAANQVGLSDSLVVIEFQGRIFKLVNPCILKCQGRTSFTEGCLSFPGLELEIKRANKVWVSALNEQGKPIRLEAEGFLAVVFQHEIDHIQGHLFIDRLPFFQRLRIYPKLKAIARRAKHGMPK